MTVLRWNQDNDVGYATRALSTVKRAAASLHGMLCPNTLGELEYERACLIDEVGTDYLLGTPDDYAASAAAQEKAYRTGAIVLAGLSYWFPVACPALLVGVSVARMVEIDRKRDEIDQLRAQELALADQLHQVPQHIAQ